MHVRMNDLPWQRMMEVHPATLDCTPDDIDITPPSHTLDTVNNIKRTAFFYF